MSDDGHIVAVIGSAKSPIRISCTEYQGRRTIDIRKYFLDRGSKELKPTTKGISVGAENFREIRAVLENNREAIEAWLSGGESNQTSRTREHDANQSARLAALLSRLPVDVSHDDWKGSSFFSVESRGGKEFVALNREHAFFPRLRRLEAKNVNAEDLFAEILAAFHRAKSVFAGSDDRFTPAEMFDLIEHNWGMFLQRQLNVAK